MGKIGRLAGLGAVAAGVAVLLIGPASAANNPTYRDCSFVGGLDPDFVQLSGAAPGPNNTLTVPASSGQVQIKASESSDPGDSSGHDTFKVTVTAPGTAPRILSGAGTGKVILTVPLSGAAPGSSYTLDWAATFDNGNHSCPSSQTPQNATANPFVVTVTGTPPTTNPTSGTAPSTTTPPATHHATKKHCHTTIKRVHGRRHHVKVCSTSKPKRSSRK